MTQITPMSPQSILIINPNSTSSMTDGLKPLVKSLGYTQTKHEFYTSPGGPTSINDEDDAAESARVVLPDLQQADALERYDAFLVACYSHHPLVQQLKEQPEISKTGKPVTGIFEASVVTSLSIIGKNEKFGIVSTGKVWEEILTDAVQEFLGAAGSERFAGVETTGLSATQLHDTPQEVVKQKMKDAVKRLLGEGHVGAVCLGCAGMSGMDEWVREASIEKLGRERGERIRIVDGVKAGVTFLDGALRARY